jgi:type IV pilus assembly protein PilC
MNKKSQLQFIRNCAILLESGISLPETIKLTSDLEKSKRTRGVLHKIALGVNRGLSFEKSIIQTNVVFDATIMSMISFGEKSGILALSMRQAIEIIEKENVTKKKIIGSLVYPAFIALATVGMTSFLVMYIFPKIIPLFSSLDITLPLLTRAVKWLYESTLHYGLLALVIIIGEIIIFVFLYRRQQKFRVRVQSFLLRLPLLGLLLQKYYCASFSRSIGTLLECGQTLVTVLVQISESTTSEIYKEIWNITARDIAHGLTVSSSLKKFPKIIPTIVPSMLSIGERTGLLGTMFINISKMYEEDLDQFSKHLSTVIEPVLMIGMGLIVGSIALSIILPIYEITSHLTH